MRQPDFETATLKATETLIKYNITSAPVVPLPIFKSMKGVLVLSFAEVSARLGIERNDIVSTFAVENHDAVTSVHIDDGKIKYLVAYNQRLPFYMLQRALARELGHIVLGHDGTLPDDVRMAEALCFAYNILCPRPLVNAIIESGTKLTVEVLGTMSGCYGRCLAGMRKIPGVHVPPELNRKVREQFDDYISNFLDFQSFLSSDDESPVADFGTYMEGYEE